jgi:hypothetical protein
MLSEFILPVNNARPVCFALVWQQTKRSSGFKHNHLPVGQSCHPSIQANKYTNQSASCHEQEQEE